MADDATQPKADEPVTPEPAQAEPTEETKEETPATPEEAPSQESSETPAEPTEPPQDEKLQETDEPLAEEQPKVQTRAERQKERKRYYDSIRREDATSPVQPSRPDEYTPRPYEELITDDGMFDTKAAQEDREAYAKAEASKAASRERFMSEQNNFFRSFELDKSKLENDPKYAFLKQDSNEYDDELTEVINEQFKLAVGYREVPVTNPQTGQVTTQAVVDRPDIGLANFVKRQVEIWDRIAEERSEQSANTTAAQKASQGMRPSGTHRALDISEPSKLTAKQIADNQDRINEYFKTLPAKR